MAGRTLLLWVLLLQLLVHPSSAQQHDNSLPLAVSHTVLDYTVIVSGTQTIGKAWVPGSKANSSSRTVIDCTQLKGRPAYLVRQGSLVLQNLVLQGCSHQAVVLVGPGAALTARNVTFTGHGSSDSRVQGIVISAQQAICKLENVVITGNQGALPLLRPTYHPACNSSSIDNPSSSSSSSKGGVCGAPVLSSSLIHLQDSTLITSSTSIASNAAAAVISATGSSQHSLQLLPGTQLSNNMAAWLIIADSFAADRMGRENLLAPHPSDQNANGKRSYRQQYTAHKLMWHLKSLNDSWREVLSREVARPTAQQFVGLAPGGQSPLQVLLRNSSLTFNSITGSLMWLRLVNTSMTGVNITHNLAMDTAAAAAGGSAAGVADAATQVAQARRSLHELQPPHLCDMGVLEGALLQVQGPAAFDMLGCNISSNYNPIGAVMRVSDGVGLTSIRSSSLCDNIATAVLRVDGRSWVHDPVAFMNHTKTIDSIFYRLAEGTSEASYKSIWLPAHINAQESQDKIVTHTTSFMTGSRVERNAVFHAVVLLKGERVNWRAFESKRAKAVEDAKGDMTAMNNVTLDTFSTMNLLSGNSFVNNSLLAATTSASAPFKGVLDSVSKYINALSFVLSASMQTRAAWADKSACVAAVKEGAIEATPKAYNIKPSVLAATFATSFLANTFASNVGFPHVVSAHSATVVATLQLRDNVADSSVLRIIDASARLYNTALVRNTVRGGSVLQGDSFQGLFEQVTVAHNTAWSNHTQNPPSSTSLQSSKLATRTADAAGLLPVEATWPIVGIQRIDLGVLRGVVISNNSAPFWGSALESNQWNFLEDVVHLTIHNNTASGIKLKTLQPYYDTQGWVMRHSRITNNKLTSEAGALHFEGFSSRVGKVMPIILDNCTLANNTPAKGKAPPLKGGGITIEGPEEDRADGSSDRGFLESLNIVLNNTLIQGNMAVEGGGVWSAWPMLLVNTTIRDNRAERAGGGMFLRGLQQDKLGQGNVVVINSRITNNTAGFGGAVACGSCRAAFYKTTISGNSASLRPIPAAATYSNSSAACGSGFSNSSSNETCLAAAAAGPLKQQQSDAAMALMNDIVKGAGGAVAAILAGKSFIRVCGAPNGKQAAMTDNSAATVGGLVYMSYQGEQGCDSSSGATAQYGCEENPRAQVRSLEQLCGIQLHDIDWSGTKAGMAGNVLAWAGDQKNGFSMHCSSSSSSNRSRSTDNSRSRNGSCGCGQNFAAGHTRGAVPEKLMTWQLPKQMSVLNTTCLVATLRERPGHNSSDRVSNELQACVLADSRDVASANAAGARVPSAFAGDAINITVSLARNQNLSSIAEAVDKGSCGQSSAVDGNITNLAAVHIKQDRGGKLFVIGKSTAAVNESALATFCDMALQPIETPLYNRNYSFSIEADASSGLLSQVAPVTITIQLLRCTLGQHLTINRCVRCAESGTFSLHPNRSCQPCVPGGVCSQGLLQPQDGFWSHNPLVPQIIPCPLKGACSNRSITMQQLVAEIPWLKHMPQQQRPQLAISQLHAAAAAAAEPPTAAAGRKAGSAHRQLLQDFAATPSSNGSSGSSRGGSTAGQEGLNRTAALQQYNRWLADLITYDPELGPYRLFNVTYKQVLDSWQRVQCNPGYKGPMCGSCDPAYTDTHHPGSSSSSSRQQPRRFALHRNECVDCSKSVGGTWAALFILFFLFVAYVSLGVFCQVNSVDKALLQADTADTDSSSGGSSCCGAIQLPCWQGCWGSAGRGGKAAAVGAEAGSQRGQPDTAKPTELKLSQDQVENGCGTDATICVSGALRDQGIQPAAQDPHVESVYTTAAAAAARVAPGAAAGGGGAAAGVAPGAAAGHQCPPAAVAVVTHDQASTGVAAAAAGGGGQQSSSSSSSSTGASPASTAAVRQAAAGGGVGAAASGAAGGSQQQGTGASNTAGAAATAATPVRTLVAMWKVLTSYVQILAMVRFLPSLWDTAAPLAFADLSGFGQFAAFDCLLPGPVDKLAYTRICLTAFGVPALLFATFLLGWIVRWGLRRAAAALHHRALGTNSYSAGSNAPSSTFPGGSSTSVPATGVSGLQQFSGSRTAQGLPSVSDQSGSSAAPWEVANGTSQTCSNASHGNIKKTSSSWLQSAASSVVQAVPPAALARLQRFGAQRQVSLRKYLSVRLTITAVVLGYSCYSLFTSNMLQTLACHPIREVAASGRSTAAGYGLYDMIGEFGALHHDWLQERFLGLQAMPTARNLREDEPALCHGSGSTAGADHICQVSGQFWKQDYSVQCFQGDHAIMAGFGAVFLVGMGVVLPVVFGLLLWRNKDRLSEPIFSTKYSFLYHEYRPQVCYWEFAIMARKLAFLGVFVALNAPFASPESVTLLQLYIAAVLSVGALLLNVFLQPFQNEWLNHLECAGLTAVTVTFLLLGASVTVGTSRGGRIALLTLTGVGNFGLVCYFLWHMGVVVRQEFGGVVVTFFRNVRGRLFSRRRYSSRRRRARRWRSR